MATADPIPVADAPAKSFPARVIGVLVSPTEAFADIVRKPSFIAPLILMTLFAMGNSMLIMKRVGVEQIVRTQMAQNPRTADMPADQREQAIETGAKFAKIGMIVAPLFVPTLMVLAVSGILLMFANFILGGDAKYRTLLSVTAYGFVPSLIAVILGAAIMFAKDPADIDIQNLVASNLGPLVDATSHKALNRLLQSFDIFSFWMIAVLACGISAAARFSYKKALLAVLMPWGLYVLGATALKAIF